MRTLFADLQYAMRQLRRSPVFAITAVLTLTMAIGANVVVFEVMNAIVLHPLPVPDSRQVYSLTSGSTDTSLVLMSSHLSSSLGPTPLGLEISILAYVAHVMVDTFVSIEGHSSILPPHSHSTSQHRRVSRAWNSPSPTKTAGPVR